MTIRGVTDRQRPTGTAAQIGGYFAPCGRQPVVPASVSMRCSRRAPHRSCSRSDAPWGRGCAAPGDLVASVGLTVLSTDSQEHEPCN